MYNLLAALHQGIVLEFLTILLTHDGEEDMAFTHADNDPTEVVLHVVLAEHTDCMSTHMHV